VRTRMSGYALATAALVLAVLIRWLLDPVLGNALPLVTVFGAVAAAVWAGGWRPAAAIAILGYGACAYFFIPPRGSVAFGSFADVVGMIAYLFTGSLIIGVGEAMRAAKVRANQQRDTLRVTLASIGEAVITTDIKGRITYLNDVAASLTGWTQRDAIRQPLQVVFLIIDEMTRKPIASPVTRALDDRAVAPATREHTVLIRKDSGELPIEDSASPIRDEDGQVSGCVLIFRDATAPRRDAQEKADQLLTARRLASIVESSDDAIISKSLDGIIQSWNGAAERVFGYPAAEAVGRHISLVIPPDRIAEEDHIIATLRGGARIDHFETERVRKDGRRILVSLTVSPIKDDEGNIVGASKVVRDVTRQRRADERERALLADAAAANAKFQAFFEQGALLAAIMELDGTMVACNRLSWEGCGYRREQIVGKRFWEGPWWASAPALVRQIEAASAQAIAGRTFRGETPYFVADGSERIADITIVPIKDEAEKVLFVAATGIDITDRKRAEADRQKFVTLVESSSDFIGMADLRGIPFFVNRAGLEMVGLDDLEQARRAPVADFFFPEDRPRIIEEFFPSVLAHGHGEIEIRFRHFKTGEARWMAYKVLTLPDAAGRPIAFATVSQDVTERKRLADDLRALAADLSEANRRKTEFLAMLAHELRNPLAPISNAVRALRVGHGDTRVARAALGMFERQVGQLARLVDDLLDLSRVTRGKIALRKQPIELVPIVEQAVEAARARYGSLDQELTVTLPTQPVYLSADPARLAQVIGNLLNNACKFTDPGGHIGLTVTHEGTQAIVRVRDDGIGIAAEQLPHLFKMFTQADTSLERTRDGLGIGLTLVEAVVEMHGGTVEARSDGLGRGSEFEVRLPALEAASATIAQAAAESEPAATIAGRRILIVDDNVDGADSLAMLLEEVGHETHTAHDGVEALDLAERIRPDAVLLDIGLPKLNGYEVCKRLRERRWADGLVIVALTGWGQEEDRQRSLDAGFDTHLVKPVDHSVLMRLLASLPSPGATTRPPAAPTPAPPS
jgi:PAS domain S-box-containing protein